MAKADHKNWLTVFRFCAMSCLDVVVASVSLITAVIVQRLGVVY